ncbi:unnamed protein product, partial [Ilex paraguariensis]
EHGIRRQLTCPKTPQQNGVGTPKPAIRKARRSFSAPFFPNNSFGRLCFRQPGKLLPKKKWLPVVW